MNCGNEGVEVNVVLIPMRKHENPPEVCFDGQVIDVAFSGERHRVNCTEDRLVLVQDTIHPKVGTV